MLLPKPLLQILLIFAVVHFVYCLPIRTVPTRNRHINSKSTDKYARSNLIDNKNKQSSTYQKYPKSNDIHYGKVMKHKVSKFTPIAQMPNAVYGVQHVVNLIAKAKATKNKHTIKEHTLMLEKSTANSSGSLVNIDVFRRLIYLQTMRRDGINLNNLGQPLIDHTVDILNKMKLGSQYPKLAFEILDGQSLLDIMEAHQPTKKEQSPQKNIDLVRIHKANNIVKKKNVKTNTDNRFSGRETSQYPLGQSENMIVIHPFEKKLTKTHSKTGRNLLDYPEANPLSDHIVTSVSNDKNTQDQSPSDTITKPSVSHDQGSINTKDQLLNLPVTITTHNTASDTHSLDQQLDKSNPLAVDSVVQGQLQNDSTIHVPQSNDTRNPSFIIDIGHQLDSSYRGQLLVNQSSKETINSDTSQTDNTSTPVTSLEKVVLTETFGGTDSPITSDTDMLLHNEIENILQNNTDLMSGLATQIEIPTDMTLTTASSATSVNIIDKTGRMNTTNNDSTAMLKQVRSNTETQGTTSRSQQTTVETEQATKYLSSPTTQHSTTTKKVTTTISANFDWCTFLCKVMKRCSPACGGHFTSWNR